MGRTLKDRGKILFLDFDGVLCDSAAETARSGWLAGSEIWDEWKGRDIPAHYIGKFRKTRPLLETGFESIALVKAIDEGYSEEFLRENFSFIMEQIFTSISMNRAMLSKLYGKVRDDWARIDLRGWLSWHSFYECAGSILETGYSCYKNVFIVTTKEKRFAEALMKLNRMPFREGMIYGLEAGRSKPAVIEMILENEGAAPDDAVIVEDRFKTLYDIEESGRLEGAALYLASWGYVFPEDVENILKGEGRIKALESRSAASVLAGVVSA